MTRDRQVARSVESVQSNLNKIDLLVLSHLRWDFVYQRPQHVLSRAARDRRVFFWEEAQSTQGEPRLEITQKLPQLWVIQPYLPDSLDGQPREDFKATLVRRFIEDRGIQQYILWYYTPWALRFTRELDPVATVYDCMDELSLFKGANPQLKVVELELFRRADVVFTGGPSLYEAKRSHHSNVHLLPSSIDTAHFAQARSALSEPADQAAILHPRLGFFGVIDERIDLDLIAQLAALRPDWHIVLLGPTAKVDPEKTPRASNIHYLGQKPYEQLPHYLAGWDVALMPFARNDATRFISPTKTPEYLAGGRPVVSTSIQDVVRPYGEQALVHIADTAGAFVSAIDAVLQEDDATRATWLERVDDFLKDNSWDRTWFEMNRLIERCIESNSRVESR